MHLETTKNKSIIYLISKIYSFISKKRKLGLKILLLTQILSGLFEFLTIGSVVPFLYLINNPEVIYNYPLLAKVITISKITNSYKLTLLFSFIFISLVLISGFVKTFNVWFSYRLSALIGADLSHNIFKKKLNQPFEIQITENSSKTINEISGCLNRVVLGLQFFLQVVSNIVLTFFITLALLVIASRVTIIGFLVILISYFVIGFFVKKELSITGNKIVIYSENQVKAIRKMTADNPLHNLLINLSTDLMLRASDLLKLKVRRMSRVISHRVTKEACHRKTQAIVSQLMRILVEFRKKSSQMLRIQKNSMFRRLVS